MKAANDQWTIQSEYHTAAQDKAQPAAAPDAQTAHKNLRAAQGLFTRLAYSPDPDRDCHAIMGHLRAGGHSYKALDLLKIAQGPEMLQEMRLRYATAHQRLAQKYVDAIGGSDNPEFDAFYAEQHLERARVKSGALNEANVAHIAALDKMLHERLARRSNELEALEARRPAAEEPGTLLTGLAR